MLAVAVALCAQEVPELPPLTERFLTAEHRLIQAIRKHADGMLPALTRAFDVLVPSKLDDRLIAELLERLGHNSFEERQRAMKRLISYGRAVIPHVRRRREETNDPEVRQRCTEILDALDRPEKDPRRVRLLGNLLLAICVASPEEASKRIAPLCEIGQYEAALRGLQAAGEAGARAVEAAASRSPRDPVLRRLALLQDIGKFASTFSPEASDAAAEFRKVGADELPEDHPLHILIRNPPDRENRREETPQEDYYLEDPHEESRGETHLITPREGDRVIAVDGNLWLDSNIGTYYRIRGNQRLTFLVSGDVYLMDDLLAEDGSRPLVTIIARTRADGHGGNIILGDRTWGTFESFEGILIAQRRILRCNLNNAVEVRGAAMAGIPEGRDEGLGLDSAGPDDVFWRFDPRLLDPEKGPAGFPR